MARKTSPLFSSSLDQEGARFLIRGHFLALKMLDEINDIGPDLFPSQGPCTNLGRLIMIQASPGVHGHSASEYPNSW